MKLFKISLLAIVLLVTVASCSKDDSIILDEADYTINLNLAHETNWELADEILVLVNEHRSSLDLPIIERDQQYASAYAVQHTNYMIELEIHLHKGFVHQLHLL